MVKSPKGDFTVPVKVVTKGAEGGPYDVVILACKGYDLDSAMDSIAPAVGADTTIVPMLNGHIHFATLDARFGRDRVAGGLALIGVNRGYKVALFVPERFSEEKVMIMRALGAEVTRTPNTEGMKGAIRRAEELVAKTPNSFMAAQFSNPANPDYHYETTAREIFDQMEGRIDAIVIGAGTSGTFTGTARFLKQRLPRVLAIAVETQGSILGGRPRTSASSGAPARGPRCGRTAAARIGRTPASTLPPCCISSPTGSTPTPGCSWRGGAAPGTTSLPLWPDPAPGPTCMPR